MGWIKRIFSRRKPEIPQALWDTCVTHLEFLGSRSAPDLLRLKQGAETFLATHTITGAGGLELRDEVAVLIAAQAALLTLNLTPELYDDMAGVIVYPSEFIVPQSEMDEAGVVHEWCEPVAGEAMQDGGAVVLSWEDVEQAEAFSPGYNVVIHEFAHKIDMLRGDANGCPPLLTAYHAGLDRRTWQSVFASAYADFVARVEMLEAQLPGDFDPDEATEVARQEALFSDLPLDPYAAENPAEFFAVATETFFVTPQRLMTAYPEVYHLLARYYRQDPVAPEPTHP